MDWDWIVEGDHVYDTRRERRSRLLRKRHMARVFRMLAAFTAVCLLLGVGVFAWIGVEQSGASRRAAQSAALAAKEDRSAEKYARMVAKARAYNRKLTDHAQVIGERLEDDGTIDGDFGFKSDTEYQNLLDFGDGIMASVEIPSIGVDLPVRHGADSYALDNGLGHLHGTSLPVGGKNTHSVITGHTGVADKALFTRLNELRKGDVFYVRVAAQTLAYKVTRIRKVDPDDLKSLQIERGTPPHGRDRTPRHALTQFPLQTNRRPEQDDGNPHDGFPTLFRPFLSQDPDPPRFGKISQRRRNHAQHATASTYRRHARHPRQT